MDGNRETSIDRKSYGCLSHPTGLPKSTVHQEPAALPRRIEALEAERRQLHEAMASPAFYQRPGNAIAQDNARLSALDQELGEAYQRWEALEALAD